MSTVPDLSAELAQSSSTDLAVLLGAKEKAKRQVMEDPSQANLLAFDKASRMLAAAQAQRNDLKDVNAVLAYVEESGRRLKKTKLYDDIGAGKLKRQPDGTFRQRDVDRYAASLPSMGASDSVVRDAASRQKRKEEADIRRANAAADRDEFRLAVERGKYIARDLVFQELAGRAITFDNGLRTRFEGRVLDYIHAVDGNPKKATNLVQALSEDLDAAMNEYSQIDNFEVLIVPAAPADDENQETEEETS